MRVVLARKYSVHKLAYHQYCGITGVVVNVFQSHIRDMRSRIFKQFQGITVSPQNADYHFEVHGEHRGNENSIILFHFFRKGNIVLFHFTAPFLQVRR